MNNIRIISSYLLSIVMLTYPSIQGSQEFISGQEYKYVINPVTLPIQSLTTTQPDNLHVSQDMKRLYYEGLLAKARELNNELKNLTTSILELYEKIKNGEVTLKDSLALHFNIAQQTLTELTTIGITISALGHSEGDFSKQEQGSQITKECEGYRTDLLAIPNELQMLSNNIPMRLITLPMEEREQSPLPNTVLPLENTSDTTATNQAATIEILGSIPETIHENEEKEEKTPTAVTIQKEEPRYQGDAASPSNATADSVGSLAVTQSNIKRMALHLKNNMVKSQMQHTPAVKNSTQTPVIEINPKQPKDTPHHRRQISHNKIATLHNQSRFCSAKKAGWSLTLLVLAGLTAGTIYYSCN